MVTIEDVERVFRAAGTEHQQYLRAESKRLLDANRALVEALIAEEGGIYDHERAPDRDSDLPPWIGEER